MLILIDNYDSFTFNVFHYLSEIGAKVQVFRNNKISSEEVLAMKPKGIILSPGPKTPDDAGISLDLIKKNKTCPMLGICLGHQSIGQAYGAEIIECKDIMHGKIDEITHFGHPIFKGIEKKFLATRYHSLIIDKKTLPNNFDIISSAKNDIIMGIAHKKHKIYGLQFHPESIGTKTGKLILQNFLKIINYES